LSHWPRLSTNPTCLIRGPYGETEEGPAIVFETYKNPLLAHNGKFDCKFVRAHLGVHKFNEIVDTMLAHQVSSCGNLDEGFGLQDSAWQFLREQVNKAEQTSDWGRANLTDKQWEYAGSDATILHPLWAEIEQKLLGQNQRHVAQLEFDIVDAMALLELNGILLDRDRWMDIYNLASADWERLRAELQELLLGPIRSRSRPYSSTLLPASSTRTATTNSSRPCKRWVFPAD
jgi:ribonuclease D